MLRARGPKLDLTQDPDLTLGVSLTLVTSWAKAKARHQALNPGSLPNSQCDPGKSLNLSGHSVALPGRWLCLGDGSPMLSPAPL